MDERIGGSPRAPQPGGSAAPEKQLAEIGLGSQPRRSDREHSRRRRKHRGQSTGIHASGQAKLPSRSAIPMRGRRCVPSSRCPSGEAPIRQRRQTRSATRQRTARFGGLRDPLRTVPAPGSFSEGGAACCAVLRRTARRSLLSDALLLTGVALKRSNCPGSPCSSPISHPEPITKIAQHMKSISCSASCEGA